MRVVDRGKVELVVEGEVHHVMAVAWQCVSLVSGSSRYLPRHLVAEKRHARNVQDLILHVIVGAPVLGALVVLVGAAMDLAVVEDGRADRGGGADVEAVAIAQRRVVVVVIASIKPWVLEGMPVSTWPSRRVSMSSGAQSTYHSMAALALLGLCRRLWIRVRRPGRGGRRCGCLRHGERWDG